MVIPSLIKKAVENDKLEVWGDGSPIRDLIYAEDVARGMIHMVENKVTEPVNLASGTGVTIKEIAEIIANKEQGFTTFTIHPELLRKMVYEISMLDLEEPPKNKIRKVIFKMNCGLCTEEKLRIVGELVGRTKRVSEDDIYQCMLELHELGKKINITQLALWLECSTRTIHRNMGEELKREKELLNRQHEKI